MKKRHKLPFFLPDELISCLEGPYPVGFNVRRETPAAYKDQLMKHAKIMTQHLSLIHISEPTRPY